MRPGLVFLQILAVWEAHVHSIKGGDQVFVFVDFLESADDARLSADGPGEALMRQTVPCTHAFLIDDRQMLFTDCAGVVAIVAETTAVGEDSLLVSDLNLWVRMNAGADHLQVFEEFVEVIRVFVCSVARNGTFDDRVAVSDQVVAEVSILVIFSSGKQLVSWIGRWNVLDDRRWEGSSGRGDRSSGGRHVGGCWQLGSVQYRLLKIMVSPKTFLLAYISGSNSV